MRTTPTSPRTFTEATIQLVGGARIEYARSGAGDRTDVVFIHGWPDSWRSFQPVMAEMPTDISAVSVSLPGFGGSDAIASPARPSDLARSVIALCDALGIERAVFVGHSLGTLVSQRIAERRPDLVRGLVLIGAFAEIPADVVAELRTIVAGFVDPMDEEFVREFQASTLAAPVPEELFETIVAESMRAPAAVWRATVAGFRADRNHGPSGITAPALLIWGDQDGLARRDQQERLLTELSVARLEEYRDSGHSPNWEQPARVAGDIAEFVAQLGV
ncbi:MAG TPA: alpha/beta hydrolase [Ilumatobacter sp.]